VRFGPKGCVSTWLNDQARCMIKTDCEEKDIDNYDFKFICVDESGEHVRHVFGKGSFDPEETFDTLVTCTSCTADADELMVSAKQEKGDNKTKTAGGPTSTNALLRQIVADVGELKVEMANASQNVERLNAAVFKQSTVPPPAQPATPAAQEATPAAEEAQEATPAAEETTPAPSSLVHRGASALRARGHGGHVKASRMNAIKAHAKKRKSHIHKIRRRHTEDDIDAEDQEDGQDHTARADDDAQEGTYAEEDARSQEDSDGQDDSQDQDAQQEYDGNQADVQDADTDDAQQNENIQTGEDDRSAGGDGDGDDMDRDADTDGRREDSDDQ